MSAPGRGTAAGSAAEADNRAFTEVAVGIVHRAGPQGWEVLMAQRPQGKPYAGWWEFPGGKLEAGETVAQALARELQEELGLQIHASQPWVRREHAYPHARVRLHFQRIFDWSGEPVGLEGQAFAWQPLDRIKLSPLLPAALPVLEMLQWPQGLALHGFAAEPANPGGVQALWPALARAGLARLVLRAQPPAGAGVSAWTRAQMQTVLAAAAAQGLRLWIDEAWQPLLEGEPDPAGLGGYWSAWPSCPQGAQVLSLGARGGAFAAASLSDADDLARSQRDEDVDKAGQTWSPQALLALSVPSRQWAGLAEQADAALYWPADASAAPPGQGTWRRV